MRKTIKFIPGNRAGIKEDPVKAGIIEIRKGLKGINLGEQKYAMAYIRVLDEHHYLKGMCIYSDKLPEEYDVIKYCLNPKDILKALKDDRDDPSMPQKLNTGVMTRTMDNGNWAAWKELLDPARLSYEFLKKPEKENKKNE